MITLDDVLQFEPPAARLLGRDVVSVDRINRGAILRIVPRLRPVAPR